ncbi:prolyl oligopeptidase family serine peptidase [Porticoccus sp. W117]|uniref:dipeptidyl-peptidase 5 n=1 Tax=Porticoccus sp. W117 TaxID=3054777 RepID=UPI00259A7A3D|nr:prolyl oligopeptidase family serine peptidase [Porticoccus sp. W117]MDM3870211.1 prolyl oligopeptidase family serine peptidase [Porticoccus sp. W117]
MKTASYGSWKSPITPQLITKAAPGLDQPHWDNGNLYWLESRPWESGRNVVMRRSADGTVSDVLPAPLGARSKVHEYGGAPYLVADDVLYFCLDADQRIYHLPVNNEGALPEPLTPEDDSLRYADFCIDVTNQQLICVCEKHGSGHEPENTLVAVPLDGSQQLTTIASGADFYSNPRISPNGTKISWLCWHHPQMPWDGTELWLADFANGRPHNAHKVAGGPNESIFQPQWSPDGKLYFVSDRSNWWNIYRLGDDLQATNICPMDVEFATPQWVFGMSTYGFLDANRIVCCYTQQSCWHLATIDLNSGDLHNHPSDYSDISALHAQGGNAFFIASSATTAPQLAQFTDNHISPVYGGKPLPFDDGFISQPQAISYPSVKKEGTSDRYAQAIYYPPTNQDYQAPQGELPPLMVMCHGGPTAASGTSLNLKAQFWASRGFAVLDVNYHGSTGFGRRYRDALKGNWGLCDVDDVVAGANHLAEKQLADPQRMAIRGGSAGGYTVLAALTFHNTFKAGASLYGIGDLEMLAGDTHKFEARYMDSLVGPYPESKAIYQERSPIHHIEQLDSPVIFLQGLDDKVVPPNQAEAMTAALNQKKIANAYVPFMGEGHGFRKAENIIRAYEAELYFYSRVFDFELAEPVEPVRINNMD